MAVFNGETFLTASVYFDIMKEAHSRAFGSNGNAIVDSPDRGSNDWKVKIPNDGKKEFSKALVGVIRDFDKQNGLSGNDNKKTSIKISFITDKETSVTKAWVKFDSPVIPKIVSTGAAKEFIEKEDGFFELKEKPQEVGQKTFGLSMNEPDSKFLNALISTVLHKEPGKLNVEAISGEANKYKVDIKLDESTFKVTKFAIETVAKREINQAGLTLEQKDDHLVISLKKKLMLIDKERIDLHTSPKKVEKSYLQ